VDISQAGFNKILTFKSVEEILGLSLNYLSRIDKCAEIHVILGQGNHIKEVHKYLSLFNSDGVRQVADLLLILLEESTPCTLLLLPNVHVLRHLEGSFHVSSEESVFACNFIFVVHNCHILSVAL